MTALNILAIEDSPSDLCILRQTLGAVDTFPCHIVNATSLGEGLALLANSGHDVVLLDLGLPDSAGLDTLRAARAHAPGVAIVVMTGDSDEATGLAALKEGAQDYLVKGQFTGPALPRALRHAIERKRSEEALKESEERFRRLSEDLEVRVRQRTSELEALNRGLESFASSVSHDLRAPVRAIAGYSQLLEESASDRLDPQQRDLLRRIRAAARRMAQLIDDLLRLARVARAEMNRGEVDLAQLAREVMADLRSAEPQREVEFTFEGDLRAHGDPRLLRIALQNLLANAWKFTRDRRPAHIELSAETRDGKRVFVVRDDGAGFDMRYAARMFQPFQRMHSPGEFEGEGIGLATVEAIVRRHGGEVWADGALGRGATFRFTLGE